MSIGSTVFAEFSRVTNKQTDGQTDRQTTDRWHSVPKARLIVRSANKTNLDLLEQQIAVAPVWPYANLHLAPDRITMPASHHSVFYRPDALPAASKHILVDGTSMKRGVRSG